MKNPMNLNHGSAFTTPPGRHLPHRGLGNRARLRAWFHEPELSFREGTGATSLRVPLPVRLGGSFEPAGFTDCLPGGMR